MWEGPASPGPTPAFVRRQLPQLLNAMERLRRDSRWPFQEIEGKVVVVVPARREVHQLDEVGTFVWKCLEAARTPEEVVAAVCAEFEVEEDRARRDVAEFLASLEEKGLVVRA